MATAAEAGRDAELRFLSVTLSPASCPWPEPEIRFPGGGDPEPVRVGPYAGELRNTAYPGEEPGDQALWVTFTAHGVVIDAETSLSREEALAALATVAPLDLAAQPVERSQPPSGD